MYPKFLVRGLAVTIAVIATLTAKTQNQSLTFQTPDNRTVTVTALTDNIIKVTNAPTGVAIPESRATVLTTPVATVDIAQHGDDVISMMTGHKVGVAANTVTGELCIGAGRDKMIIDNGVRTIADGKQQMTLMTTSRGSYYGAGERGHKLNLRGDTLVMYNRQNYGYTKGDPRINQMNITMPLFLSSDGFAIVFDDYAAAEMILGEGPEIKYITESNAPVSYYYVNGASTLADVTKQLSLLTGRQPLPPLWSLGYITSKYGYHNQQETLGAIDSLKTRGYPVDGIVLDLYWYGKEQDMGRLAWDPIQWPDPVGMLDSLSNQNVNLVAISQPYILRNGNGLDNYNTLAQGGMLVADSTGTNPQEVVIWVGEGGMFDVSNPDTRQWMADRYAQLTDMGIGGWWGDLGEPEVHPESALHANGLTARQYHNQYGNDWSEIIYDLFRQKYPYTRLLTMMRGGTTGLQRYSVFPWSTDVSRSWGGLQPQITIMLNSGLSGLGYMGHDVGGFAIDPENPIDPELYVRWLQLGLFSPMLRTHAQYNAEPYHYPEYQDITLALIKERYRWLPYNYTLAYQNARFGYPLVRPLNFNEPGVNDYDAVDDEFLWGSEVLVAPVVNQGATSRDITLPQGIWIDYNKPENAYAGPGVLRDYPAPLEVLPMFVKAGSFIPQADYPMESTADYLANMFTINYYPFSDGHSEYTLYDDNRMSPTALADGQYRLIHFVGDVEPDGNTTIKISSTGTYPMAPSKVTLNFDIKGIVDTPSSVTIDNGELTQTGDHTFTVKYVPGTTATVNISYR